MSIHLLFCMRTAAEKGISAHPQDHMHSLGIKYQHATPQSMGDQWWFWNCENIPNPLPFGIGVLDILDPEKYVGFGLTQEDADKIKNYKGTIEKKKMYEQKCMNCGRVVTHASGSCLACDYHRESADRPIVGKIASISGVAVFDETQPIIECSIPDTVSVTVNPTDKNRIDMKLPVMINPGLTTMTTPQSKKEKPSLCEHKAEFKCTASMDNPMERCRFFAPDGHLYWLCISRTNSTYECLNPTAKAEALSKQVAIVEELSARIAELEAKWAGANLEAHGILKLIHDLTRSWDGSARDNDRLVQLLEKAANKFRWDK